MRIATWVCRILGPALVVLFVAIMLWTRSSSTSLSDTEEYTLPGSGDMVLTMTGPGTATCDVWPADGSNRTITVPHESGLHWEALFGPRLPRWYTGTATIHCRPSDKVVLITGGPVAFYELGRSGLVYPLGLVLSVWGWRRWLLRRPAWPGRIWDRAANRRRQSLTTRRR